MSRHPDSPRLSDRAEALLGAWPSPHRDALDWEQMADQTLARIRDAEPGSTDDALLAAPLPATEGEPSGIVKEGHAADEPPPSDLSDIARRAVNGQDASAELEAVAKETWALAVKARPILLDAGGKAAPGTAAAAALQANSPKRRRAALDAEPARSEPPPSMRRASDRTWLAFGAAGALAAAAGLILLVKNPDAARPPVGTPMAAPSPQAAPAPVASREAPVVEERHKGIDLSALEPASPAPEAKGGASKARPSAKRAVTLARRREGASGGSADTEPKDVAKSERNSLEDEAPLAPAARNQSIGERPSAGAVSAAFGAVTGTAKQCLAGQEQGSSVVVTFGPDGRVRAVAVTGPAAETPAASCLESAFRKARVEPFGAPEFSARWTVTPP